MAGGEQLERGRTAFARWRWRDAYDALSAAELEGALAPEHLDQLAIAAYLIGRETDATAIWTRAHHGFVDSARPQRAARCGFWLSMTALLRGEGALGAGWLARAERILDDVHGDCAERGLLWVLGGLTSLFRGDAPGAAATFERATDLARRLPDADLLALGLLCRGQAAIELGEAEGAVSYFDEAMVAVTAGEVSPIIAGVVYCAVILACQDIFDLHRARQWTAALAQWCGRQPELVSFRGKCLVHRSEIMQLEGDWSGAVAESERACEELSAGLQSGGGIAFYRRAELHRLSGELDAAERLYRMASERGYEPQPGLSLLRLAQGNVDAAAAAMRRLASEISGPSRARILGPFVEIMIAAGDHESARTAADELAKIVMPVDSPWLAATRSQAKGAVLLAEGDAAAALTVLREAYDQWQLLQAIYESARVRVLIGRACRELGDQDTAQSHMDAAIRVFDRLRASVHVALGEKPGSRLESARATPLTDRELGVLGLVTEGRTNREIAAALHISEHTVARHLANIFAKLGVGSRTAASAYAFERGLAGTRNGKY
jgi:DNA-binding NarL/FixJ family response regulator